MLLIHKVKIFGFKSPAAILDAQLSGDKISIIYGENGCGKTTFLKILHATLAQDESVLMQNNIEAVLIEYSYRGKANIIRIFKSENEDGYNWNALLNSELGDSSSISLGVDRGVINRGAKIEPRYIFEFFRSPRRRHYLNPQIPIDQVVDELSLFLKNTQTRRHSRNNELSLDKQHLYLQNIQIDNIEELLMERYRLARLTATRRIQSALFDTLSLAIDVGTNSSSRYESIPDDFNSLLYEYSDRMIEALDDGEPNQFKDKVVRILESLEADSDIDKIKENPILCNLFINVIEEIRLEKLILNSINVLVYTFNKYLINDKELIVNGNEIYVKAGIDTHGINELSSGERHILTFLSLVLFEGVHRDFIIIDEPEISLNIKWQREIIPLFSSLVPDTQIIVASHSPSLANQNMNYLCELELNNFGNL